MKQTFTIHEACLLRLATFAPGDRSAQARNRGIRGLIERQTADVREAERVETRGMGGFSIGGNPETIVVLDLTKRQIETAKALFDGCQWPAMTDAQLDVLDHAGDLIDNWQRASAAKESLDALPPEERRKLMQEMSTEGK